MLCRIFVDMLSHSPVHFVPCGDVPGIALHTAEIKVTDKEPFPETVHGWRAGPGNLECHCR